MINKQSFSVVEKYKQVNISKSFAKRAKINGTEENIFLNSFLETHSDWTFWTRSGEQIIL